MAPSWLKDLELLNSIVKNLYTSQKKFHELLGDARYREIFEKVSPAHPPIPSPEALSALLPSRAKPAVNFQKTRQFLYLEPPERFGPSCTAIPVVSIRCDFQTNEFRVRIPIFFLNEEGELSCWGFRYEAPEGGGEGGMHDYFHAQYISSMEKGDRTELPAFLEAISEKCPAFPLDAKCPPSLFLAAVISLYGVEYVFRDVFLATGFRQQIDTLVHPLHFNAHRAAKKSR